MRLTTTALLLSGLFTASAFAAPIVHTTDFIANNTRTALVDFEPLPDSFSLGSSFSQAGVNVNQLNGHLNGIWSACFVGACWANNNSSRSWYPNGGDPGWTELSLANGLDFDSIGMDLGSGFGPNNRNFVQYELLNNGSSVLLGTVSFPGSPDAYLGFSGGGFDTIRLRNSRDAINGVFGNGALNALAIDNIELATSQRVPEPGALALVGIALMGAALTRRQRKAA